MGMREATGTEPVLDLPLVQRGRPTGGRRWLTVIRRFASHQPLALFGAVVILFFLFCAIFADVLAPYSYAKNDLALRLKNPSALHKLGTDAIGRDVLSRLIFGTRITMFIDAAAVAVGTAIAMLIG